ncbi:Receptor-like protein 6 [Linum perenne]
MKLQLLALSILISIGSLVSMVSGRCQSDQQSLLLQLKQDLIFEQSYSNKLAWWNASIDCCKWPGITCDHGGHGRVIGLDLSDEYITGGLEDSSTLFSLQYLHSLDLSFNDFSSTIPSDIANLTSLRHLQLSRASFFGQVPASISRMTSLVSLDLSFQTDFLAMSLELRNPNLAQLVQNLTRLVDLRLDYVDISAQGKEWCKALSSSLPNLQVLSMFGCLPSGPVDPCLSKLKHLSVVHLSGNNFSSPVPEFFAHFRNLTSLRMSDCGLTGTFPAKILQIPSLEVLDLSDNYRLEGVFPDLPQNHSMDTLILSNTNFSGVLPPSMGNLGKLSRIDLQQCRFSGNVPKTFERLTQLEYLDLSHNNFTGLLPSLSLFKNLMHLDLSHNQLSGYIPRSHSESFEKLFHVDLSHNSFDGSIPSSLFVSPSLDHIDLSFNQLRGTTPEFPNVTSSSSALRSLDLSNNNLEGPISRSFFKLPILEYLNLSFNKFNGTVQFSWIHRLQNLTNLDLSYNNLTVNVHGNNSSAMSIFPQFSTLHLASCNMRAFPELGNQSELTYLDLSGNNINGVVPRWILESTSLSYLNLSHNNLVGLEVQYAFLPWLNVLDIHDNQFQGDIPITQSSPIYIDYSHNLFNGSIPTTNKARDYLSAAAYISISNNRLRGAIPASICHTQFGEVLDLSNNHLNGTIPGCLVRNYGLSILDLRGNMLSGDIPDTFQDSCSLKTLDLSRNQLQGRVPKSLENCTELEVLDIGNNKISDVFPCLQRIKPSLRILILRNNLFHGSIGCPLSPGTWIKLQIVDLAINNFSGPLNVNYLATWEYMMLSADGMSGHLKYRAGNDTTDYEDSVVVSNKGLQREYVKILKVFRSVDFSSNNFDGQIPEVLGKFRALQVLNLSHNAFTGNIPSAFGNLSKMESLDLSHNKIKGHIPDELTGMRFLEVLNLSDNNLVGRIPTGNQFQTFDNTSFADNPDLCVIEMLVMKLITYVICL